LPSWASLHSCFTVAGTLDDRLKNLMREVQELRRERQSIQPKTDN
jgi:hypothetical protein